jgi:hypothetical protein
MDNHDRRGGRMPAWLACCLAVGLLAGACGTSKVAASHPAKTAITNAVAVSAEVSSTAVPAGDPSSTDPTPTPSAVPVVTAPPVTAAKRWIVIAVFSGSGEKEGNTFTITGAPARVTYRASGPFLLNIDTGDPADDTTIGSCPPQGCAQLGAVHVVPGGWYLHVIQTPPATTYSITLQEFR